MATTSDTKPVTTDNAADPFSGLTRMSTTAGVGSYEYIAVNSVAVAAILTAVAGILAIFSNYLLPLPAFASVFAIIALVQIIKSNGTQTGKKLAVASLLISLGVVGKIVYEGQKEARAYEASRAEISALFDTFYKGWSSGDHQTAWSVFGPAFHSRVKYADFDGFLKTISDPNQAGKLQSVKWNEKLEAVRGDQSDIDIARAVVIVTLEKAGEGGISCDVMLVRRPTQSGQRGPWQIEQLSPLFDNLGRQQPPAGQQGQQGQTPR